MYWQGGDISLAAASASFHFLYPEAFQFPFAWIKCLECRCCVVCSMQGFSNVGFTKHHLFSAWRCTCVRSSLTNVSNIVHALKGKCVPFFQ